jgi:hypothetical protein
MNSPVESKTSYSLAVMAVGTALVVLFAGACVIVAVNRQVPQELWAAASVLSGALVGILIPTPSGGGADHVAAGASFTHRTATSAAHAKAKAISEDPREPMPSKEAAKAAVAAVKKVRVAATVKKVRNAITPASDVIDTVVGAFDELGQEAQSKLEDALANVAAAESRREDAEKDLAAAKSKRDDAQAAHPAAEDQLQAAQAPGQQHIEDAETLQAKVSQAQAALTHASEAHEQAGVSAKKAEATQQVHAAAAEGAAEAQGTAAEIADPGSGATGSAPPAISKQMIGLLVVVGLVLLALLVVALWLAIEIAQGNIHPANCPLANEGKTQGCDSNLQQIGTVVLSLAAAAGGTLLGLFATPDGKSPSAGTTSQVAK